MEKFNKYLKLKGFKLTQERRIILEQVFSVHDHFDVEDLLYMLRKSNRQVSRASVYRTLSLLVESGLVEKVDFGDGRAYYEHVFGHLHHDHLICKNCGKVVQFEDMTIEKRQKDICKEHGFQLEYHTLNIFGFCTECQKEDK
ncbi:transcriptional repressor [Candidatus Contubernalis alkalaceticus]|nr:transcriptional repressor [Candidatus Contubernalis alkalaceticus]